MLLVLTVKDVLTAITVTLRLALGVRAGHAPAQRAQTAGVTLQPPATRTHAAETLCALVVRATQALVVRTALLATMETLPSQVASASRVAVTTTLTCQTQNPVTSGPAHAGNVSTIQKGQNVGYAKVVTMVMPPVVTAESVPVTSWAHPVTSVQLRVTVCASAPLASANVCPTSVALLATTALPIIGIWLVAVAVNLATVTPTMHTPQDAMSSQGNVSVEMVLVERPVETARKTSGETQEYIVELVTVIHVALRHLSVTG